MAERLIAPVLKTGGFFPRGFESHPLRSRAALAPEEVLFEPRVEAPVLRILASPSAPLCGPSVANPTPVAFRVGGRATRDDDMNA